MAYIKGNKFFKKTIHEDDFTLESERDIMRRFFQASDENNLQFGKVKMVYGAEGVIMSKKQKNSCSEICAWIEIKCRNNLHNKYPTLILGWNKYCNLMKLSQAAKEPKPVLFIVAFTDGIYLKELLPNVYEPVYFHNRNVADSEPSIEIPISELEFVCQGRPGGYFPQK